MRGSVLLFCLPILWLAFSLGVWRLDVESIWHDEAWSIRAIRSPIETPDDNTPPLYYLTLHILHAARAGESPFALRYGSVLIFLLVVAFGYRIGWRWYGLVGAVMAGVLLGLSPLLWEYAQEVRAYIAVPFFALLMLAGAEKLLASTPKVRIWAFVWLAELAALYTHNLAVPLVIWLNVMVIVVWGWRVLRCDTASRKFLMIWIGSQAVLLLLYLPWLLTQSPSGTTLNTVPQFNAELSRSLWRGYIFPVISKPDDLPKSFIKLVHVLPLLAGISVLLLLWRGRTLRSLLIFSQVVLLPIFSTLLLIRASIDFHPRYYILVVPGTLLLLVAGVNTLPSKARWAAAALVVISTGYITQQSLKLIEDNPKYQHDDFRSLAQFYATLPADTLILIPYEYEPTLQYYYAQKLGIKAKFLPMPLHASPVEALEHINAAIDAYNPSRIDLLTWFQVPADERGMYYCLLQGSSSIVNNHDFWGLSDVGYAISGRIEFHDIPFQARFKSPLQLIGLHYIVGETPYICIWSDWQLTSTAQNEYMLLVTLQDSFGGILDGRSGFILGNDQARAMDWQSNEVGGAFVLLQNFYCIINTPQNFGLRQFSQEEYHGVDLLDSVGRSLGKDFRVKVNLPRTPCTDETYDNPRAYTEHNEEEFFSGQRLELYIRKPAGKFKMILSGNGWSIEQFPPESRGYWWTSFQIPTDADGEAHLFLDDTELASYTIIKRDYLFEPPVFDLAVDTQLSSVATLTGATVHQADDQIQVDLVWQSLETPNFDYTVFVQLLDQNGQVLAQVDDQPAGGERPTTGWIAGEYILDSHTVKLNDLHYKGQATIIMGMYDPMTFERLRLADGSDFVRLPLEITLGN